MTMPQAMRTRRYVYGVQPVDGFAAWKLFEAAAHNDCDAARKLLKRDESLVNAQHWYQQPMHLAVRAGHAEMVKLLLDHGADPGQSRFLYYSWDRLLQDAIDRGYVSVHDLLSNTMRERFGFAWEFEELKNAITARDGRHIRAVLRRSPDLVHCSDALGNTAVHWAVLTRQRSLIHEFAEAGAPIDAPRADGRTPLLLVCERALDYHYRQGRRSDDPSLRNSWVMGGDLLSRGADDIISSAAAFGDLERVRQLVEQDNTLAWRLNSAGLSPLTYAAREGYVHIVEYLLDRGARPNQPEDLAPRGRALFDACQRNHLPVVKLLLEHGADPNADMDSSGCCLTICRHYHGKGAVAVEKLLREYGARTPGWKLKHGEIREAAEEDPSRLEDEEILHNVMNSRDTALLTWWLDRDPSLVERLQAYSGVICPKHPGMLSLLLERGLDVNRRDWLGKTFLHLSAERADVSAARLLLDARADLNARDTEFKGTPLAAAVRAAAGKQSGAQAMARVKRMVSFLLRRGASVRQPDDEPWATPLAWAEKLSLPELVAMLSEER